MLTSMKRPLQYALLTTSMIASAATPAAVVTFENAATYDSTPSFNYLPITELDAYAEHGFTVAPVGAEAFVFGKLYEVKMPGNDTDWLGIRSPDVIAFTRSYGSGTFGLGGLRLGPMSLGSGGPVSFTFTGHKSDGAILTKTFSDVTSITSVRLDWERVTRVEFTASDYAGLDDIEATADPSTVPSTTTVLMFEGITPPGRSYLTSNFVDVTPEQPYRESGFQLTPAGTYSSLIDGTATTSLPGVATDWLGFTGANPITLTRTEGDGTFDLLGLQLGSLTNLSNPANPVDVTITGTEVDGGTVTETFAGVTVAIHATLGWRNLTRVVISSTGNAGVDNIEVRAVPEPGTWAMLGAGLTVLGCVARRRQR